MTQDVVRERMKGFVSITSHPEGCAAQVRSIVDRVSRPGPGDADRRPVLVIGSSGGYGLPAAATAAFGLHRPVVGIGFDKPAERKRTGTAGWYNTAELLRLAADRGETIHALNGDAFSDEAKDQVIAALGPYGPPALVVYSLAAPVRTDPDTGVTHRSVLKPVGAEFTTKTLRIDDGDVREVTLEPATQDEVADTVKVMGGEDWSRWIDALDAAGLVTDGFRTVAFDYVGPEVTHPIYRSGTIGQAKAHLEATAHELHARLASMGGGAWTSVNAAAVTQSSAAIPAVPLYLSLLLAVTGPDGTYEDPTTQMMRLFEDHLGASGPSDLDDAGRIRLDRWELDAQVQAEVARRWAEVETGNLAELGDFAGFQERFRQLFGFGVADVDYDVPVDVDVAWPTA